MVIPMYDYLLLEKIVADSGVVTDNDVEDTHQLWKVLQVGPGREAADGHVPIIPIEIGDTVWTMKHAEADTPKQLKLRGLALVQASRVMAAGDL